MLALVRRLARRLGRPAPAPAPAYTVRLCGPGGRPRVEPSGGDEGAAMAAARALARAGATATVCLAGHALCYWPAAPDPAEASPDSSGAWTVEPMSI